MTTSYKERFNLRKDYYVQIDPRITITLLSTMWGLLPLLAFFPNALDMVLNDTVADFIEENRFILVKFFNVQVWLHMIECIIAIQFCRRYSIGPQATMKWIINVSIHGIFALKHLLWPKEDIERIKVH